MLNDSDYRLLRATMNFDLLAADSALDVTAPMILAVATVSPRDRFGRESTAAAHRPTSGRTWVVF